jgi:hypothetical protein
MPSIVQGIDGVGTTFDYPKPTPEGPYRVLDQYHSKPSRLRVAGVGAGASGLCLAYKMEKMLEAGSWELTLFEKNSHFGGTWLGMYCEARLLMLLLILARKHIPRCCLRYSSESVANLRRELELTLLSHTTTHLLGTQIRIGRISSPMGLKYSDTSRTSLGVTAVSVT